MIEKWTKFLREPVDGASLAFFRICYAACLLENTWTYTIDVNVSYLLPKVFFSFIPGMIAWPGYGMYIHFAILAMAAVCIGLGYCYRLATIVFFIAYTYLFLLEKGYYQNHFYLISLMSFLFIFIPANRTWAVDNAEKKQSEQVPRWAVLILKLQIAIVYFYGGVAKFNYDWLHGQPQTAYLQEFGTTTLWGQIVSTPLFAHLVTFGGIAVDLSLGFLLFWRPTFWLGAFIALCFHLTNSRLFPIGIFSWLMICTIGLFAPYDWPRKVYTKFFKKKHDADATSTGVSYKTSTAILVMLHVYIALQLLIPLRRFLYPGETSWTELGHRFSWSMMLRTKLVKTFEMNVTDPSTGQRIAWDLTAPINVVQTHQMMTRPDMILRYAHYIADSVQQKTGVRPIVRVKALESLNLRPVQDFIDPNVNLAEEKDSILPFPWVEPLENNKHDIPVLQRHIEGVGKTKTN